MVSTEIFLFIPLLLIGLVIIFYRRPDLIYNLLLVILHFMYSLYKLYLSIPLLFLRNRTPTCASQLSGDIKYLDKIPKHLAVMFWSDDIQEERLIEAAQLCCWAWCFGVKTVSIYEPEGHLKEYIQLLQYHINTVSREFISLEKILPTIQVTSPSSISSPIENETNQSDLLVNLISRSDGRARIVETTKSLTKDVIQEKIKYDDVNIQELDRRLKIFQIPEPQLLISFSSRIDLDGFPPWQIHLTEIFHVPDNPNFSYSIFLQGLRKYSKCNQRFGK
ncbi:unnamed protein product [Rhizophagus irregularis]|uniref:ditrans,polycis-polyprenyl diphosphate synthase [(2E,6E)-farnesyldiphosphate specific] n=1 Tax=Rhizophagus irregularis TaxID=588596 RepID=A0A2N1NW14_9GLOM|nr:Undecaprenyl diphosphate synthase [Rhizophagus irregularis]CAB4394322.1 unnamed protein product [Rhizophagus irregularis]